MQLLIDTWNVLHQVGILPPESAGMEVVDLFKMIQNSRFSKHQIAFVCDGTPSQECPVGNKVRTIFTGHHRTADDEIIALVNNSSASRSILVVTSDREIIRSIKIEGAQHAGSSEFLRLIVEDNRIPTRKRIQRPSELSQEGAAAWKEVFGVDDDELEKLQDVQLPDHLKRNPAPAEAPDHNDKLERPKEIKDNELPSLPTELVEEARRMLGL